MSENSANLAPAAGHRISRISRLGTGALSCWMAVPERRNPQKPPLVAIHGLHRGAKAQVSLLAPRAASSGQTVIAPLFDRDDWPHYQQVVRKRRADLALLSALDDLAMAGMRGTDKIELCGYSGGAQFAHRFAMLYPHRVARLTLIAAGWYTFPDPKPFPYGLGTPTSRHNDWQPRSVVGLAQFLSLPIRVLIGTEDDVVDENTRSSLALDAQQGRTRRERAARWASAIDGAARHSSIQTNIKLIELDGCGHDFRTCLAHPEAERHLFPNPQTLQVQ
ncbi:MAG: alpha/beta hydrolase [Pseudomonadota bacterium]